MFELSLPSKWGWSAIREVNGCCGFFGVQRAAYRGTRPSDNDVISVALVCNDLAGREERREQGEAAQILQSVAA